MQNRSCTLIADESETEFVFVRQLGSQAFAAESTEYAFEWWEKEHDISH